MKYFLTQQRGFTLLYGVLTVGLLLAAVLSITSITVKQLVLSGLGRESQIAFYSADSGLECFHYWDARQNAFTVNSGSVYCADGSQSFGLESGTQYKTLTYKPDPTKLPEAKIVIDRTVPSIAFIQSFGHNSYIVGPRQVERALEFSYPSLESRICPHGGIKSDIVILVDTSDTGDYDVPGGFSTIKALLSDFTETLFATNNVRMAVSGYDSNTTPAITLSSTESTVQSAINLLQDNGAQGSLSGAIAAAQTGFAADAFNPDYLIIVTPDTRSSSPNAQAAANAAKGAGITLYTVGYKTDEVNSCSTTSCSAYYDIEIAGDGKHLSGTSRSANYPYGYKYAFVAHTRNDLSAILSGLANCK